MRTQKTGTKHWKIPVVRTEVGLRTCFWKMCQNPLWSVIQMLQWNLSDWVKTFYLLFEILAWRMTDGSYADVNDYYYFMEHQQQRQKAKNSFLGSFMLMFSLSHSVMAHFKLQSEKDVFWISTRHVVVQHYNYCLLLVMRHCTEAVKEQRQLSKPTLVMAWNVNSLGFKSSPIGLRTKYN